MNTPNHQACITFASSWPGLASNSWPCFDRGSWKLLWPCRIIPWMQQSWSLNYFLVSYRIVSFIQWPILRRQRRYMCWMQSLRSLLLLSVIMLLRDLCSVHSCQLGACFCLSATQVCSAFEARNHVQLWQAGDSASIWRYAQSREQASASPWQGASRPSHWLVNLRCLQALHTRWSMWSWPCWGPVLRDRDSDVFERQRTYYHGIRDVSYPLVQLPCIQVKLQQQTCKVQFTFSELSSFINLSCSLYNVVAVFMRARTKIRR